jgi:hypothetical protein
MPARYFRVSTCRTSVVSVAMLIFPEARSPGPELEYVADGLCDPTCTAISMSTPAVSASLAASALFAA